MPVSPNLQRWLPLIRQYATKYGVPPELLAAIVNFESGGDPNAGHRTSGATGLGQVMPREAGFPGRPTRQELLDPDTNLDWSARILADGYKRWGSPQQAAAAYLGALDARGNVTNAADANGTTGHAYVAKIMGTLQDPSFQALGAGAAQPVPQGGSTPSGGRRYQVGDMVDLSLLGQEGQEAKGTGVPSQGGQGGRLWPVAGERPGSVTNPFGGQQFHSSGSEGLNLPDYNTGADLAGRYGEAIVAEAPGTVVEVYQAQGDSRRGGRNAQENFGYGGSVSVKYDDSVGDTIRRYSHQAAGSVGVRPGQRVGAGEPLGQVGDSGNATGPHVDYMTWDQRGQLVDGTQANSWTGSAPGRPSPVPQPGGAGVQNQGVSGGPAVQTGAAGGRRYNVGDLVEGFGQGLQQAVPGVQGLVQGAQAAVQRFKAGDVIPGYQPSPMVAAWNEAPPTTELLSSTTGMGTPGSITDPDPATRRQPGQPSPNAAAAPTTPPAPAAPAPTPGGTPVAPTPPAAATPPAAPAQAPNPKKADAQKNLAAAEAQIAQAQIEARVAEANVRALRSAKVDKKGQATVVIQEAISQEQADRYRQQQASGLEGVPQITTVEGGGYATINTTSIQQEQLNGLITQTVAEQRAAEQRVVAAQGLKRQAEAAIATEDQAVAGKPGSQLAPGEFEFDGGIWRWKDPNDHNKGAEPVLPKQPPAVTPKDPNADRSWVPIGDQLLLLDKDGRVIQAINKPAKNEPPQIIGSSTGSKVWWYDPATGQTTLRNNEGYTSKRTQVTAGEETRYLVEEDEQGNKTVSENPNYNPWSAGNTVTGTGINQGKVTHIDREGNVHTADTLTADERALLTRGETAKVAGQEATTEGIQADTAKKKLDADIARKKQEAMDGVRRVIDAGGTPQEVNTAVRSAAQDVTDFINLMKAENEQRTTEETIRHNTATEGVAERTTRTGEAAESRQGAESYGRYGLATAPFQTALLASQAPVTDVRKLAGSMNINPSVSEPVASTYDVQKARQTELQKQGDAARTRRDEPFYSATPNAAQAAPQSQVQAGATAGSAGSNPAVQPVNTARTAGQQYSGTPITEGGQDAVDLGPSGRPGWARTNYNDSTYEDWQIPQPGQGGSTPEAPPSPGPDTSAPQEAPAPEAAAAPSGDDASAEGLPGALPGETIGQRRKRYYEQQVGGGAGQPGQMDWGAGPGPGMGGFGGYNSQPVPQAGPPMGQPAGPAGTAPPSLSPSPGPENHGVGGYFVGGGQYQGPDGQTRDHMPMYVSRYGPAGAGQGGGGAYGGGGGDGGSQRRRLPVPGRHVVPTSDPEWARTEYDDGSAEEWMLEDGPSFEGVGGRGAGYHGELPPTYGIGWSDEEGGTGGGGGSIWYLPPGVGVGTDQAASTALDMGAPQPQQPTPSPVQVGGYGGPQPGGGGAYGATPFGTAAPPTLANYGAANAGGARAPMWDAATPGSMMTSGVGGTSGGAGQATLYGAGASPRAANPPSVLPTSGATGGVGGGYNPSGYRGGGSGSYYGGPPMPQAMSPLQRLLQQSGVMPLNAGRATGMPGTI